MPKTIIALTANDPLLAARAADQLKRLLDLHGHCRNALREFAGQIASDPKVPGYVDDEVDTWACELDDAQSDRSDLVLLLHALEDAARVSTPVARPALAGAA